MRNFRIVSLFAAMLALLTATCAFALSSSGWGSSSFAYDLYDTTVNKILKGPIGFVGGTTAIVFGAMSAIQAKLMLAIPAILGGAAMLKADTIVQSLGCLI